MVLHEVKNKALDLGIKPKKLRKADLIRLIQKTEGNFDCYGTAVTGYCDRYDCAFRDDCLIISVKNGEN